MSVNSGQHGVVEVRIPIMQRSTSVLDQDYGGSGGQFAEEMRKMEEEMNKLTGQINEGNKRIASRIIQKTTTTTTRTTSGGGSVPIQQQQQQQPAIQYQSPGSVGGVQSHSSHTSTYSHQTSGTQGHQSSPVPVGLQQQQQQQQHHTSTFTHQNSGSNLQQQNQQQQQPSGGIIWAQPQNSSSPASSVTGSNVQQHSSHTTTSHKTVTHHDSGSHLDQLQHGQQQYGLNQSQNLDASNSQELQQWMGDLNSPLIHDHQDISNQDGKCLRLRFDVSQYSPDEISVKTVDGKLRVHAKHEEKSEHKSAYREFNKEFSLPIGTNPEAIKSTLSKDGILTVEAPLPGQGYQQQAIGGY